MDPDANPGPSFSLPEVAEHPGHALGTEELQVCPASTSELLFCPRESATPGGGLASYNGEL